MSRKPRRRPFPIGLMTPGFVIWLLLVLVCGTFYYCTLLWPPLRHDVGFESSPAARVFFLTLGLVAAGMVIDELLARHRPWNEAPRNRIGIWMAATGLAMAMSFWVCLIIVAIASASGHR